MIGQALLGKIIGSNTFRTISGSDLMSPVSGPGPVLLQVGGIQEAGSQDSQALGFVFVLTFLILT